MSNASIKPSERRRARQLAMQALYQWDMNHMAAVDLHKQFIDSQDMSKVDRHFFESLLMGAIEHAAELDQLIVAELDRSIDSLTPVELAILRMSTEELQHHLETPYKVVINEGIELAKKYGAEQGHKYINGVLDKLAIKLRVNYDAS